MSNALVGCTVEVDESIDESIDESNQHQYSTWCASPSACLSLSCVLLACGVGAGRRKVCIHQRSATPSFLHMYVCMYVGSTVCTTDMSSTPRGSSLCGGTMNIGWRWR